VNWQVTATTIYCDAVDDEVTILVYKDGSTKCTGYDKYGGSSREVVNPENRESKKSERQLECEGSECYRVVRYKEKLFPEN